MSVTGPILRPVIEPVLRSVFDPPMRRGSSWSPAELFANGEQGALYYFTPDFAGLYQDAAGTTPVTAAGQPVGLMLDRRFGLVRGPELAPAPSGWLTTGTGQVVDGEGVLVGATSGDAIVIPISTSTGSVYEIGIDLTVTEGQAVARGRFGTYTLGASGVKHYVLEAISADNTLRITGHASLPTSAVIHSVSVRELPGNHASQTTTTARPTLRSGPLRIDYDGVDDYLRTVFPDLGSDVTIARSIPGVGAQILTGQAIAAGDWDDNVTSCATLVIDRALTGPETALVTAFLNQQAGV